MSGWCEFAGHRKYIEDHHSIVLSDHYKYFGVFDGHHGSRAAKFSSKNLHLFFETYFDTPNTVKSTVSLTNRTSNHEILAAINGYETWKQLEPMIIPLSSDVPLNEGVSVKSASEAMLRAFNLTNYNFIKNTDESERSGTTATVIVLYREYLLLRHVSFSTNIVLLNNPMVVMLETHELCSAAAPMEKPFNSLSTILPTT